MRYPPKYGLTRKWSCTQRLPHFYFSILGAEEHAVRLIRTVFRRGCIIEYLFWYVKLRGKMRLRKPISCRNYKIGVS
jgi:hypothetical protein